MAHIGEIIESSTARFVAQSYQVNSAPPLGSLVRAQQEGGGITVYGVVTNVETTPLDPSRRPVARGRDAASLADIIRDHPQLMELFRTSFDVAVVGHQRGDDVYQHLPPLPPEVHQLVFQCSNDEVAAFSRDLGFLPLLLTQHGGPGTEEVLAAFLRRAADAQAAGGAGRQAFQVQAGKRLVPLLRGESVRLATILAKLR